MRLARWIMAAINIAIAVYLFGVTSVHADVIPNWLVWMATTLAVIAVITASVNISLLITEGRSPQHKDQGA